MIYSDYGDLAFSSASADFGLLVLINYLDKEYNLFYLVMIIRFLLSKACFD